MYLYIYIRFKCSDRNVTTVGFYLVEAKCEPRWKLIEKLPLIFYEHIPHSLISRSNTIKRLAKYFLTFISIRSVSRGVKMNLRYNEFWKPTQPMPNIWKLIESTLVGTFCVSI